MTHGINFEQVLQLLKLGIIFKTGDRTALPETLQYTGSLKFVMNKNIFSSNNPALVKILLYNYLF